MIITSSFIKAAASGFTQIVKLLLENNAEVDAKTTEGATPLHCGESFDLPLVFKN